MKKKIVSILLTLVLSVGMCINASAEQPIKIIFDGKELILPTQAVIENGTTLVPLRVVFEAFGAAVEWNNNEKSITATKDKTTIWLQINNATAKVGTESKSLSVPSKIVNGNTLVPIRFVSEAFGVSPIWDNVNKTITITTQKEKGKLFNEDGSLWYEGELVNGIPNGKGIIYWNSGDRYEGDIIDNELQGYGVCYWSQGDRYEGQWVAGNRHGYGVNYKSDGTKLEGNWEKDEFVGDKQPNTSNSQTSPNNKGNASLPSVTSNDTDINKIITSPWIATKDGNVYMTLGQAFQKHFNSTNWSKFNDMYGNKLIKFEGQAKTAWGDQMLLVEFYMGYDGDLFYFTMSGQQQETLMGEMMIQRFYEEDVEEWANSN